MTLTASAALLLAGLLVLALVLVFRIKAAALATFGGLTAVAWLATSPQLFLAFVLSFVLIALAKLVTRLATGTSDVAHWHPANFLYSAGPPVLAVTIGSLTATSNLWELSVLTGLTVVISDSASAEIGTATRAPTYLISSGKPVPPGTDGGISLLGTAAGVLWTVAFALAVRILLADITAGRLATMVVVALFGNLTDSLLGATLQRKGWVTNDQVNGVSVSIAMLVALALALMLF